MTVAIATAVNIKISHYCEKRNPQRGHLWGFFISLVSYSSATLLNLMPYLGRQKQALAKPFCPRLAFGSASQTLVGSPAGWSFLRRWYQKHSAHLGSREAVLELPARMWQTITKSLIYRVKNVLFAGVNLYNWDWTFFPSQVSAVRGAQVARGLYI